MSAQSQSSGKSSVSQVSYIVRNSLKKRKSPNDKSEKFEELKVNEVAPNEDQKNMELFEEEKVPSHD